MFCILRIHHFVTYRRIICLMLDGVVMVRHVYGVLHNRIYFRTLLVVLFFFRYMCGVLHRDKKYLKKQN